MGVGSGKGRAPGLGPLSGAAEPAIARAVSMSVRFPMNSQMGPLQEPDAGESPVVGSSMQPASPQTGLMTLRFSSGHQSSVAPLTFRPMGSTLLTESNALKA